MKTKIWLALLSLYFVWGSTYLAIQFTIETLPPFLSAGIRFLVAGLIVFTWRWAAGDALPTKRQWVPLAIVGVLLLVGGNGLVSYAEQFVPSGIAALIIGSIPIWMIVIDSLRPRGEKPNRYAILGLFVGFVGIFLLVGPADIAGDGFKISPLGGGILLMAAFLWSLGSIYSRETEMPKSTLMTAGAEMLAGSLGLFLVSGLTGEWGSFSFTSVTQSSWLGLLYLITFGSLIGFVSYSWLLQNAPVSLVATYAYVNPLVAVLLGAWLANEVVNARILFAGGLIIGSVVLIHQTKKQREGVGEQTAVQPAHTD